MTSLIQRAFDADQRRFAIEWATSKRWQTGEQMLYSKWRLFESAFFVVE